MAQPWETIDTARTDLGTLTLERRGDHEFLIKLDSHVVMTSRQTRSEVELADVACRVMGSKPAPRVLIAGLGMGFTLRAALDRLPPAARVTAAEINPVVVEWCRGPLAGLTDNAVADPRVDVHVGDVGRLISSAAKGGRGFDAIILDLYEGTHRANDDPAHPHYGRAALDRARQALVDDGVLAVWTEEPDPGFERRLQATGLTAERVRSPRKGPRYVVYIASRCTRPGSGRSRRKQSR